MTAYLMTRGTARKLDYRFVGDGPPQRWWSPLDDLVILSRPTVVVRGGPDLSGTLISGIPSIRRDVIGTPIRFTLVVEDVGPALVARLVTVGLDERARAALGAELDAAFPSELVEGALRGGASEIAELTARLEGVLETDVKDDDRFEFDDGFDPRGNAWVGSAERADAVAEFRRWSRHLGRGLSSGWAFTTAGLSSADGVRSAIAVLGEPAAVLLDEGGPDEIYRFPVGRDMDGGLDPGKAQAGPEAGRTRTPLARKVLIGALALVVAAVAMAVVLLASGSAPLTVPAAPSGVQPTNTAQPATPRLTSSAAASTPTASPTSSLSNSQTRVVGTGQAPSG